MVAIRFPTHLSDILMRSPIGVTPGLKRTLPTTSSEVSHIFVSHCLVTACRNATQ